MFVLKKVVTYFWPVKFEVPQSGGTHKKETLNIEFKRIPQSEIKKLLEGEADKPATDVEFSKAVVVGWKDVQDEDGSPIEFSSESLQQILEVPMVAKSVVSSYLESIAGSKVKN